MATGNQAMGHKGMVIRLWKNDIKLVYELNIRVTKGTSSHREISATAESTKKNTLVCHFSCLEILSMIATKTREMLLPGDGHEPTL